MPLEGYSVGAGETKNTIAHKHIHLRHDLQRVGRWGGEVIQRLGDSPAIGGRR